MGLQAAVDYVGYCCIVWIMADTPDFLSSLGLKDRSLSHIHLSQGVVGKSSFIVGILIATIMGVALFSPHIWLQVTCIGLSVFVFLVYFASILWFAHRNPAAALLEGADLVEYKQAELSAMHQSAPENTKIVAGSDAQTKYLNEKDSSHD